MSLGTGIAGRKLPRRARKCASPACDAMFVPNSAKHMYHSTACQQHAKYLKLKRKGVPRNFLRGINKDAVCRFCQATWEETSFANSETCDACHQSGTRNGHCKGCGYPMVKIGLGSKWSGGPATSACFECEPPKGSLEVVITCNKTERTRTIYRRPENGVVHVAGRCYVIRSIPLHLWLSWQRWVLTRN